MARNALPPVRRGLPALLMDRSVPGRHASTLPVCDVPLSPLPPADLLRDDLPLPEVSEGELVRYFLHLSQLNYAVDTTFYPLGSCTMKYNPKWHDEVAGWPGFAQVHPLQPEATVQGTLRLLYQLQQFLSALTGLPAASLAPLAGAHGELAGMLIIKAYQRAHGQDQRDTILVPDTAHGTNPASAAMAGFKVVTVPSDAQGNVDLSALKDAMNERVAGLMLTLPNTLGLFEPNVLEVSRIIHEGGALFYGDGANFNALLGQVHVADLGVDVLHLNLHKTFSTPHGGGGPGAGPVLVREPIARYLPAPIVQVAEDGTFHLVTPESSIGRIGGFAGNFGVLLRAYCYIRSLGAAGLREVSEQAVLSANYLRVLLKDVLSLPYERTCMHEAVFSAALLKAHDVRAHDIAKRLIDYGFHPPITYFPLIVPEALMIEPTETESKETLDAFTAALSSIVREAREQPEWLRSAPHGAPVARLDEARAARQPDLRWRPAAP